MKIDSLVLGMYETNCYILRSSEQAVDCLIVDPGLGSEPLVRFLREHELNPVAVVLTHGHVDHIAGIASLRQNYPGIKVCIHKLDAEMLSKPEANLSAMTAGHFVAAPAEVLLEDGGSIDLAGINLRVLHTPGHTPGGICLYAEEDRIVFTDDVLFAQSVGRTDFPGGSMSELVRSIRQRLCALPDETVVYPGHGPASTIGIERASNPFLR